MELQNLNVTVREKKGKGPARRVRAAGEVPATVYGGGKDPASLSINLKEFQRILHGGFGGHAVVQLAVLDCPDLASPALLKEIQRHPVSEKILHVDFQRIRLDERIQAMVSIQVTGQAKGVVDGGVLEHILREIEVECLALEVPDQILVDVTELGIGDSVHVAQITPPAGVTILTESTRPIVSLHMPRVVREAVPVEGVEAEAGEAKEGEAAETPPKA